MYQSALYAFLRIETPFFELVKKYLSPSRKDRILEIGCNRGRLVRKIQGIAPQALGIDINKKAINSGLTGNLFAMDATRLDFPDASFDKIYSAHTIEHIPDLVRALKEMARVLKKGGKLFLIYPAEPIRGLFCLLSSLLLWQNPLNIHVHKLSPQRLLKEFVPQAQFLHVESTLSLSWGPQYLTLLERI